MTREQRGIEADALGVGFHDVGDRLRREALGHRTTLLDRAEYRPSRDAGGLDPRLQRGDWAGPAAAHDGNGPPGSLLVSLAVPDDHLEAELALLEILDV